MPLCLIRLWRQRLWDELKDLSHWRHGCFFICFVRRKEGESHPTEKTEPLDELKALLWPSGHPYHLATQ